ncbi:MAG: TolC family protein [Treponema sp.]|nr:TolC family protein [Treponema sp.]
MHFGTTAKAFLISAALLSCPFAMLQAESLTLREAVERARDGNLSIQEGDISVKAAKRASSYSWNSVSPTIRASGNLSKALPESDTASAYGRSSDAASISLGASINIGLSPSIATSIKGARLSYEKQLIDYDSTVRTIELNVRRAFYQILYEQEYIALQERNAEMAKTQYDTNKAKYERGVLPRLDVLNSQISWQNAQLSLDSARTTLANDLATFKNLLGLGQSRDIELTGNLDDYTELSGISTGGAAAKTDAIASLEKQIEIAQNSLLATRLSAYAPTLSAGYSYNLSTTTDDMGDWNKGGTLSVGVSIPLDGFLPWSSGAQSIAKQKDSLELLQLQLQDAQNTQAINVSNYLNQVKNLESTIALRKQSLEFARESYQLTLDAYNSGTKDILALQNARNGLLEAAVNLKSQAYNLAVALLNLENALGLSFGSLSGIDE